MNNQEEIIQEFINLLDEEFNFTDEDKRMMWFKWNTRNNPVQYYSAKFQNDKLHPQYIQSRLLQGIPKKEIMLEGEQTGEFYLDKGYYEKPDRDIIKSMGGVFDREEKRWFFPKQSVLKKWNKLTIPKN